jgi:hypothetical protein
MKMLKMKKKTIQWHLDQLHQPNRSLAAVTVALKRSKPICHRHKFKHTLHLHPHPC